MVLSHLIRLVDQSQATLYEQIRLTIDQIKISMFATGTKNLDALKAIQLRKS